VSKGQVWNEGGSVIVDEVGERVTPPGKVMVCKERIGKED